MPKKTSLKTILDSLEPPKPKKEPKPKKDPVQKKEELSTTSAPSTTSEDTISFGAKYRGSSYTVALADQKYVARLKNSKMCQGNENVKKFLDYCDKQTV